MEAVLGDYDKQQEIRDRTPFNNHCKLLRLESPSACLNFDGTGAVCPNHPFKGLRAVEVAKLKAQFPNIEKKKLLAGILLSIKALPQNNCLQSTVANILEDKHKQIEQENLAMRIGNRVTEILNSMFSK